MSFKFLKDNNMESLIPVSKGVVYQPMLKITYREEDIRRICKDYMNDKLSIKVDESDFYIDLLMEMDFDNKEVGNFFCEIDESLLSDEDLEKLKDEDFPDENQLEYILSDKFGNPDSILVSAYYGLDDELMVVVELPISHYEKLKNKNI